MSTYAAMLALKDQFGIDSLVDLVTFQSLDIVFNNVRQVSVLEEKLCDPNRWRWTPFDHHIDLFNLTKLATGKALLMWPTGIASEEEIHGVAQLFMKSIQKIRAAFTFRKKFRDAAHQLLIKASRVFKPDKKKKKRVEDADFVCVHIRRKDHLEFEAMNKMPHLSRGYFIQAMDFLAEQLRHPIFVIVTDDPGWAKRQIPPGFRPFFTGFYNESVQDSAGLDLAVLASCNYTILSRGTFGLWGNILSGSPRLFPKHFLPKPLARPLDLKYQVPLIDLSHGWLSETTRQRFKNTCPSCLLPSPSIDQTLL